MKRSSLYPAIPGAVGVTATALLLVVATGQPAHAFGGLWSSQREPVAQTAAQVIFVDNPDATVTAIVRMQYAGPAQEFVWLIPVPGEPTVAVSSSTVFERLDAATAPEYWVEVATAGTCAQSTGADAGPAAGEGVAGAPEDPSGPVLVLDRGSVGPYEYLTVAVDPNLDAPAEAALEWLAMNGYRSTDIDGDLLAPYLRDGFNLFALKLGSGVDAGAIRPVALTYESERPAIPLRLAARSAQDDMRLQVWVVGPSHAVPDNYSALVLNDAVIDWLSGQSFRAGTLPSGGAGPFGQTITAPSNYDAVVSAAADEAGGRGFVTELAAPASQFRDKVWATTDDENFATLAGQSFEDGIDAVLAAAAYYGAWDGWNEVVAGAVTLPDGVTADEFARDPDAHRGAAEVDVAEFLQLLDEKVVRPVADAAVLFYGAPYLTRLYTIVSSDELTVDPAFGYNFDLAQINNVHVARQVIDCNGELEQDTAPWRMVLPQGGVVVGEGSGDWPVADGALPANLKIVMLGSRGSGTVVEDNSDEIGASLWEWAGAEEGDLGAAALLPTQNGLLIGGSQRVTVPGSAAMPDGGEPTGDEDDQGDDGCTVVHAGVSSSGTLALIVPLAGLVLAWRRRRRRARDVLLRTACALACLGLAACSDDDGERTAGDAGAPLLPGALTREQLRDPDTCKGCHPIHYREWSSSMHAYSAQDPVFLAMNARGQRETDGELGDFCVRCHAPMAVIDGLTTDGLNLAELPDAERGVSCFFCHNAVEVEGDHNAMLRLADDFTMRGPIRDPLTPDAHGVEYSELFDDERPESSALCGGCHDIVTPNGVHLERTFQEYLSGIFSRSATGEPPAFDSCVGCHMTPQQGFAAVESQGAPMRTLHEHLWPGVDVALTDFPNREALRSAVEDCELGSSVAFFTLEVTEPDLFTFQLETGAGHNQPSGSAQDRRMWLEFLAYDESGQLLADVSSGNIADGEIEEWPADDPKHDPNLLLFRDRIYDAQGEPVHMFWEAEKSAAYPEGYESTLLPVAKTTYIEGKNAIVKQYRARTPDGGLPARVTARLRMRPIGMDVLHDLVDSGDLDREIVSQMPTFTFGAQIEWTRADGVMKPISAQLTSDCTTYRCMLHPDADECD